MKYLALVSCVVLFFACCESAKVVNGSGLVDFVFKIAKAKYGDDLDPFVLSDISYKSAIGSGLASVPLEISLYNITLSGLNTLRRKGDALTWTAPDGSTMVQADISAGVLNLFAKGTAKALRLGPTWHYTVDIGYIELDLLIVLPKSPEKQYVKSLKIVKLEGFEVSWDGPGIIVDFISNAVFRIVKRIFRDAFTKAIEVGLHGTINKALLSFEL